MERSLGTGVVIIDNGTILTNLHVVYGARRRSSVHLCRTATRAEAAMVGAAARRTTSPCCKCALSLP